MTQHVTINKPIRVSFNDVRALFKIANNKNTYNFINPLCVIIYEFYKKYSFGEVYLITDASSFLEELIKNKIDVKLTSKFFNHFGIYFDVTKNIFVKPEMNYIVLSSEKISPLMSGGGESSKIGALNLLEIVKKNCNSEFKTFFVIELFHEYYDINERSALVAYLAKYFDKIQFFNKDLETIYIAGLYKNAVIFNINYYKRKLPGSQFVNLYPYIYKYCISEIDSMKNAISAKRLLSYLVKCAKNAREAGRDLIYYYSVDPTINIVSDKGDSVVKDDMEQIYAAFSTILISKYLCKCIINTNHIVIQKVYCTYLLERSNMYVYDYLKMLENYPDVTIYQATKMGYYCVIDKKRIAETDKNYMDKFNLTLTSVKFDLKRLQMMSNSVVTVKCNYYSIKPLDFHDYFKIDSPKTKEAIDALKALNKMVINFKDILERNGFDAGEVLHQGNLLLYEHNSEVFLGYVSEVNRKLPFICYPMDTDYSPFSIELSNSINDGVMNLGSLQSIFSDLRYRDFLEILYKKGVKFSTNNLRFRLPSYSNAIILSNILYSYFNVFSFKDFENLTDKNVFATADEMGIWCEASRQFRKNSRYNDNSYYLRLVELFDMKNLRDKGYLTFYGGFHPLISLQLTIKPDIIADRGGYYE